MKYKKGFTLAELLVVAGVFSIFITSVTGIFVYSVRAQKTALELKKVVAQTNYAIELMGRNLRMAEKDRDGTCILLPNTNYQITRGGAGIKFINVLQDHKCQEFFWDSVNQQIKFDNGDMITDLTSPNIKVSKLNFELSGDTSGDYLQPLVKIVVEAQTRTGSGKINLQTSISQRNPDTY
ncbi:type II secretion system protein [bacterium]|nr:type II secretion system protein [bacterium]